jgi:hypothetical protein
MKHELTFVLEKATKNTYKFQEVGDAPKIGTLYVQKLALPSPLDSKLPDGFKLKVTLEA